MHPLRSCISFSLMTTIVHLLQLRIIQIRMHFFHEWKHVSEGRWTCLCSIGGCADSDGQNYRAYDGDGFCSHDVHLPSIARTRNQNEIVLNKLRNNGIQFIFAAGRITDDGNIHAKRQADNHVTRLRDMSKRKAYFLRAIGLYHFDAVIANPKPVIAPVGLNLYPLGLFGQLHGLIDLAIHLNLRIGFSRHDLLCVGRKRLYPYMICSCMGRKRLYPYMIAAISSRVRIKT
ncbi:hypothetical protein D3C77_482970 [compost metagenome]